MLKTRFHNRLSFITAVGVMLVLSHQVFASDTNYNDTTNPVPSLTNPTISNPVLTGNVGIGTTTPQSTLAIVGGNVGIGTWTAAGGNLIINGGGNVGIGSAWPGQMLDVQGVVRAVGLTMSGQAPSSGYILTASDSAGDMTWEADSAGGWGQMGTNIYTTTGSNNVGIGTTTPQGGLVVTNGNVGIGTWAPITELDVEGASSVASFKGNVGIGTWIPASSLDIESTSIPQVYVRDRTNDAHLYVISSGPQLNLWASSGSVANIYTGNAYPLQLGTNNATAIRINTNENVGIGTTLNANTLDINGSVGIGTAYAGYFTAPTNGLIVQGNVGIGSSAPGQMLDVQGTVRDTGEVVNGNVGIGTTNVGQPLYVIGNTIIAGNVGIGTYSLATITNQHLKILSQTNDVTGAATLWLESSNNDAGLTINDSESGGRNWELESGGTSSAVPDAFFIEDYTSGAVPFTINSSDNVGIGTSLGQSQLTVINNESIGAYWTDAAPSLGLIVSGNVGIGTFTPNMQLETVGQSGFVGNIGIGTVINGDKFLTTAPPNGGMIVEGDVGIGSSAPGVVLDLQGSFRASTATVPTVASGSSDCGTSPSITGSNVAGAVTVGTSTNGGKCTVTFNGTLSSVPHCFCNNRVTANACNAKSTTTTTVALTGTLNASDVIDYWCVQ